VCRSQFLVLPAALLRSRKRVSSGVGCGSAIGTEMTNRSVVQLGDEHILCGWPIWCLPDVEGSCSRPASGWLRHQAAGGTAAWSLRRSACCRGTCRCAGKTPTAARRGSPLVGARRAPPRARAGRSGPRRAAIPPRRGTAAGESRRQGDHRAGEGGHGQGRAPLKEVGDIPGRHQPAKEHARRLPRGEVSWWCGVKNSSRRGGRAYGSREDDADRRPMRPWLVGWRI
jgi:hypothetical protein